MATPRARGGVSLTTWPPIRISPLVCCSSPQMMRRKVVLPQPDGPSSTMNSPSGTVSEMPLTAGTSPNILTISLVNTAAIEPPGMRALLPPAHEYPLRFYRPREPARYHGPRLAAQSRCRPSGLAVPLPEDGFGLLCGPLDGVFRRHGAGRCFRH